MLNTVFTRKLQIIAATCAVSFPISAATSVPAVATNTKAISSPAHSADSLLGSDGEVRHVRDHSGDGLVGREVVLGPGDELMATEDGKVVYLKNAEGAIVGEFSNPQVENDRGETLPGLFVVVGGSIITIVQDGPVARDACGKATLGKWTYRIGAAGVCGAFGAGSGGVGGAVCGLGAAAAEDQINFDKVC